MEVGFIDGGIGTYEPDARAVFMKDEFPYAEVIVFRNWVVSWHVLEGGSRIGDHHSLSELNHPNFIRYLHDAVDRVNDCDCEQHYDCTAGIEFFVPEP